MRRAARAAALGGAALAVGIWTSSRRGKRLDTVALEAVNRDHGAAADRIFSSVTELGSLWAAGAAAAALAADGHRRKAARALAAATAMWGLGQGLKRVFARRRPYETEPGSVRQLIASPHGASWPSSHPAVLTAFLVVAARELDLPAATRGMLGTLAAIVGISRSYVGVHYPSDVVAGLLLGRAVGIAASGRP